jgi:pyridoxal phosphate enzyme (YggS family)
MECSVSSIGDNLNRVQDTIDNTLAKIGRKDSVTIVAVTKTQPPEIIEAALLEGISIIGENRVQEAAQKYELIGDRVRWHMVGHLQRNKVKQAVQIFEMIQSIDKVETAAEIDKRVNRPLDVLIEINSSGEDTRSGVEPADLFKLVDGLLPLNNIRIRGLMTIGPFTDDETLIRQAFSLTRKKYEELASRYEELEIDTLSMGMSADYTAAIEEGSNMVRLGTVLFGTRRY